jgi:hypothetical protein
MQDITVRRYANPAEIGYAGWIEPRDKSWIAFVDLAGKPTFFLNRDPVTGGILSDDASKHEAEIAEIAEIRRQTAENAARD